ncbi:MAG: serine hydroxymethyltransferase [Armatimonadetes bacterium]|nr:serine hydroxymethyltransferase [Armatimonadota bacterium]MCX7777818.1 serine hydroxymethyltransferase [Armatimonadota bacterium]
MAQLLQTDPQVFEAIVREMERQNEVLNLIASENYASEAVLLACGQPMSNKYAEGYPSNRYYAGCEHVDEVEMLAIERAKQLFGAEHANVQPHSGTQANMAVYFAILKPGDVILSMRLDHGGHLSHGARANFSGRLFNVIHYGVRHDTETIDYDDVARKAREFKPKLIITGYSSYTRTIDFATFREICDDVGAYLLADIAHIAGLVAAGVHSSPLPHAHFVTLTTHKTLRGPRGGLILCEGVFAESIDKAVFPFVQGGPMMHIIAAKAVCLKEAMTQRFKDEQRQTVENARALAEELMRHGFKLVSGGTDNHMLLVDLRPLSITGIDAERWLSEAGIIVNRNSVPFDEQPPSITSGIRIGTAGITTRGMRTEHMQLIGKLIAKVLREPTETVINNVRQHVRELCESFPVYSGWIELMRRTSLSVNVSETQT